MRGASFVIERYALCVAASHFQKNSWQRFIQTAELMDVGKDRQIQQTLRFGIGLEYKSLVIENNDAGNDVAQNQFVILFLFPDLLTSFEKQPFYAVESLVECVVMDGRFVVGETKRIISAFDGIEHEGDLTNVVTVDTNQRNATYDGQ